jgi:predicted RecA/RadA family phage recombinase
MPQATFVAEGRQIDYTPAAAVAVGDVIVQGDLVGVVTRNLAANELGSLVVEGVYDFNKATNVAYTVGTILYWDDTNNIVTATATSNKTIGKVIRAAATTDTTVRMRLSQ